MISLRQYLKDEIQKGNIDFSLRASVDEDGVVSFYIHPQGKDGTTEDFKLIGERVLLARAKAVG